MRAYYNWLGVTKKSTFVTEGANSSLNVGFALARFLTLVFEKRAMLVSSCARSVISDVSERIPKDLHRPILNLRSGHESWYSPSYKSSWDWSAGFLSPKISSPLLGRGKGKDGPVEEGGVVGCGCAVPVVSPRSRSEAKRDGHTAERGGSLNNAPGESLPSTTGSSGRATPSSR